MTDPAPPTVAGRLRGARRRGFVGRVAEVELFAEAIRAPEPPFCVLWVHGPGGVGKSALLDAFAAVAETAGRTPARLDLRTIEPSPPAFAAALAERRAPGDGPLVALLDTFEAAGALEDWLRDELIPAQPAGSLVVVAGRGAPAEGWRRDPGWRDLLRVVSLRNLDPEEAHALLARAGVDPALHARALELTHGHPLALSLLVDVIAQRGGELDPDALDLGAVPDVLEPLLSGFLAGVPSPRHRLAVEAAAQARSTTAALLHDARGGRRRGRAVRLAAHAVVHGGGRARPVPARPGARRDRRRPALARPGRPRAAAPPCPPPCRRAGARDPRARAPAGGRRSDLPAPRQSRGQRILGLADARACLWRRARAR